MTISVPVTEMVRNFADYINRVVYRGERFEILRGNRPVAQLSPLPVGRRLAELPGLLASLPALDAQEAAAFQTDLAQARAGLDRELLGDPWASS